jgi:hypothetical protein
MKKNQLNGIHKTLFFSWFFPIFILNIIHPARMGEKKERKKKEENNCVIVRHSTVHELNLCFLVWDKHSMSHARL